MMKTETLIHIGNFGVDSGQVLITDPCYVKDFENWEGPEQEPFENHKSQKGRYGYLGAAGVTLSDGFGSLSGFLGVVSTTGYGDGVYPVYAKMSDDRVSYLVIDFLGEFMEQDGEHEE